MNKSSSNAHVTQNTFKQHLSKSERFPKVYKESVKILKEVKSKRKSVKNALYSSKFRGQAFKKVYAVTYNVLKHLPVLDRVIQNISLLTKEPHICLETAEVLIHEIAVKGNPLLGENKKVLAIKQLTNEILREYAKHENESIDIPCVPRYVRVHTLVTTVPEVIDWLHTNGYNQVVLDAAISLSSFIEAVRNLAPGEFLQDFHFEDVLVFRSEENLSNTMIYQRGHIFMQDKASCIPVHVLAPNVDSKVLDCCAAPGMKTLHLACVMGNQGQLIALDRDKKRFLVLEQALKHGHVTNCSSFCLDFTKTDPTQEPYQSVEYILLDPTCSGSGMISRMDACMDDDFLKCSDRIQKLSGFQIVTLKHAFKFPNVKRIVYSTCSVNEEENEFVIQEALAHYSDIFRVSNAFPDWPTRGLENYEFGHLCVRSYCTENLTNGFFVAVLERIQTEERYESNENLASSQVNNETSFNSFKLKESRKKEAEEDCLEPKKKKRKSKHETIVFETEENISNIEDSFISDSVDNKHKKHKKCKRKKHDYSETDETEITEEAIDSSSVGITNCGHVIDNVKKDKKKHKLKHYTEHNYNEEKQQLEISEESFSFEQKKHNKKQVDEEKGMITEMGRKAKHSKKKNNIQTTVFENPELEIAAQFTKKSERDSKHKNSQKQNTDQVKSEKYLKTEIDISSLNIENADLMEKEETEIVIEKRKKHKKHKKQKKQMHDELQTEKVEHEHFY